MNIDTGMITLREEVRPGDVAAVRALVEAGMSVEEVLEENPLAEFESRDWPFITTERMTRTLYRDLTVDP